MHSHIARSQSPSWLGVKYRLSVRLYVDAEELRILRAHRLDRVEVFADPQREDFNAAAAVAHDKAAKYGLVVIKARETTAIAAAEITAIIATVRSLLAFTIRVADLLHGVTIEHRSLRAIADIETVLTDCLDHIDAAVRAARSYCQETEDLFAPGPDDTHDNVPPAAWGRNWRR